jgi:hypothetical protein
VIEAEKSIVPTLDKSARLFIFSGIRANHIIKKHKRVDAESTAGRLFHSPFTLGRHRFCGSRDLRQTRH